MPTSGAPQGRRGVLADQAEVGLILGRRCILQPEQPVRLEVATQTRGSETARPNRHAHKHFHATRHPIIEVYDPPEHWGWCYVDEYAFDLSDDPTPQRGPIPRFY